MAKPGVATENANAVIAKVQAFVDAAAKVTVGMAMNTASTIAKQISDAYQFANDALAPLNLPAGVLTVWKAADVVLPSIEAMIGVFLTSAANDNQVAAAWSMLRAAAHR